MNMARSEMEIQSIKWLKKLGITSPCGLDKLNGVELRDLARQIEQALSLAKNMAAKAAIRAALATDGKL